MFEKILVERFSELHNMLGNFKHMKSVISNIVHLEMVIAIVLEASTDRKGIVYGGRNAISSYLLRF